MHGRSTIVVRGVCVQCLRIHYDTRHGRQCHSVRCRLVENKTGFCRGKNRGKIREDRPDDARLCAPVLYTVDARSVSHFLAILDAAATVFDRHHFHIHQSRRVVQPDRTYCGEEKDVDNLGGDDKDRGPINSYLTPPSGTLLYSNWAADRFTNQ